MKRRKFSQTLLQSLSSYALLESLMISDAIAKSLRPISQHWALQLEEYCADLKKNELSLSEWQTQVDQLYQKVELEELMKFIDFKKLIQGFQYPDLGVKTKPVFFPTLKGLPPQTSFIKKIFGMKKGRAIIPHGHSNMVSAHLVLKGEMRLRHYEKIASEEKHLIIKPSLDTLVKPGDASSISDEKNNIHWFVAHSEAAFTFDIIVLDLEGLPYDIHNLDIYERENLAGGQLRVPILKLEEALTKYGAENHH